MFHLFCDRIYKEKANTYGYTGICNIENRKRVKRPKPEIDLDEIGHTSPKKTIDKITNGPGKDQGKSNVIDLNIGIFLDNPVEEIQNEQQSEN